MAGHVRLISNHTLASNFNLVQSLKMVLRIFVAIVVTYMYCSLL